MSFAHRYSQKKRSDFSQVRRFAKKRRGVHVRMRAGSLTWSFSHLLHCVFLIRDGAFGSSQLEKKKVLISLIGICLNTFKYFIFIISILYKLPWRNWLARSAVNRKVGGSSPPGSDILFVLTVLAIIFQKVITNQVWLKVEG